MTDPPASGTSRALENYERSHDPYADEPDPNKRCVDDELAGEWGWSVEQPEEKRKS